MPVSNIYRSINILFDICSFFPSVNPTLFLNPAFHHIYKGACKSRSYGYSSGEYVCGKHSSNMTFGENLPLGKGLGQGLGAYRTTKRNCVSRGRCTSRAKIEGLRQEELDKVGKVIIP